VNKKKESLIHLFWDCEFVQTICKHPTLVDTASDKATELFFDPTIYLGLVDSTEDIYFYTMHL